MKIKLAIILFLSFLFSENTCIETKEYNYFRNEDKSEEQVWDILRNTATKEFFKENFTFYYSKTERSIEESSGGFKDDYSSYKSFVNAGQIEISRIKEQSYTKDRNHFAVFKICYNKDEINEEIQKRIQSEEENKVIAIVAFVSEGLSKIQRDLFKNKLEDQIKQISPYDLLSFQKVDQILKESGKITTDQCNEAACAVDLGRDLDVDLVLQPTIYFQSDSESIISLTIFDVESSKVVSKKFESRMITGFNDLLRSLERDIMDIIIDASGGYTPLVNTQSQMSTQSFNNGFIRVNTKPQGASIILDGVSKGKTNTLLKDIPPGEHNIVLSLPNYNRLMKRVIVSPGQTAVVDEILIKEMGNLLIKTNPEGANIFLNGNLKGNSQGGLSIDFLEIGDYRLTASMPNYQEHVQTVTVDFDRTNTIFIILDPLPAKIRFFSSPNNAEIYLDGKLIGNTNSDGFLKELYIGEYTVTIKHEGYMDEEQTFVTTAGGSNIIDLSLRKKDKGKTENKDIGFLSANISPKDVSITIDNKKIGSNTLDYYQLLKGKHSMKISTPGFKSHIEKFEIISQKHNNSIGEIILQPIDLEKAKKKSHSFPGVGHLYAEQKSKGIGWLVGGVVSLLAVHGSMTDYNEKDDLYNQAYDAYITNTNTNQFPILTAQVESAFDDRKKSMNMLFGSVSALASIWIGSVFDFKATINEYNKIQAMVSFNVKF